MSGTLNRLISCVVCGTMLCMVGAVKGQPKPRPNVAEKQTKFTPEQQGKYNESLQHYRDAGQLAQTKKFDESAAMAEKALLILRSIKRDTRKDQIYIRNFLSLQYVNTENFTAAKLHRRAILKALIEIHGEKHWQVTDARLNVNHVELLARLSKAERLQLAEATRKKAVMMEHYQQGRFAEAVQSALAVGKIHTRLFGKEHRVYASRLNDLGFLYNAMGDHVRAEPLYQQALDVRKKVLGVEHPDYATSLGSLGDFYLARGDYAKAEPLLRQAVALFGRVLGEEHPDYLLSLTNLGNLYSKMRDYAKAESAMQKTLELNRKLLGEEHPDYARSLNTLGVLYGNMGEYSKAEPLYRQALEVRKKVLGEEHLDSLVSLTNLGVLYSNMREYTKAEPLYRRVLELNRSVLGEEHPKYAASLNNLGLLYKDLREYAKAEPLFRRALELRKKVLGEEHHDYMQSLNNLGVLYIDMREYTKAEPLLQQALELNRKSLGEEHAVYMQSLNNLGVLYMDMGEYAKAEQRLQQALALRKKVLGEEHVDYAWSLHQLGSLYEKLTEYAKAKALLQQALRLRQKVLGEEHPDYINSLNRLGLLYTKMGDYLKAEPLFRQTLKFAREVLGEEHPDYATSLNNLGFLYEIMGDNSKAEPLWQETLELRKKLLGEEHPDYALSLNNLGSLYANMGEYSKAEPLYRRALEIKKKVLGEEHPEYAPSLGNLGMLYKMMGEYARAEPLLRQELELSRKVLGEEHPDYAASLDNLGSLYSDMADYAKAEPLLRQGLKRQRKQLELCSVIQSERQQLAMADLLRATLDGYLALAIRSADYSEPAFVQSLAWKGAVLARQRLQRLARSEPQLQGTFAELQQVSSRLAKLAFATPEPDQLSTWRKQLAELTEKRESLEAELSRRSEDYRRSRQKISVDDLRSALPAKAALVDFLEFWQSNKRESLSKKRVFTRHVAAFVVRADAPVQLVDLGPQKPIAEAISQWRENFGHGAKGQAAAQTLRRLLWLPLEEHLADCRGVLISPDGALSYLPFAALPGSKPDSYLIEELPIAVIPSPQMIPELFGEQPAQEASPSLLVVGDVDFGAVAGEVLVASRDSGAGFLPARRAAPRKEGRFHFSPIPGAAEELQAIDAQWKAEFDEAPNRTLQRAAATEEAFRRTAPGHRYLHLATHGFFNPEGLKSALDSRPKRMGLDRSGPFGQSGVSGWHPGLLSGLALAGANRRYDPGDPAAQQTDDGILTALEVATLDLRDTDLVVLSACETGLGKQSSGEGLLGLQRAFQVAGARTVVASLWQVDDAATRDLMTRFYHNLWHKKLGKLEALRQAQLSILNGKPNLSTLRGPGVTRQDIKTDDPSTGRTSPRLWAAWVLSGDPGAGFLLDKANPLEPTTGTVLADVSPEPEGGSSLYIILGAAIFGMVVIATLLLLGFARRRAKQ